MMSDRCTIVCVCLLGDCAAPRVHSTAWLLPGNRETGKGGLSLCLAIHRARESASFAIFVINKT